MTASLTTPQVGGRVTRVAPARVVRPLGTPRSRRQDALVAFGWISTAVAVMLYLADGGLHSITGVGDFVTALGVVAGLVATNGLLLMLLLAARIPAIDAVVGQVKANEWHRDLGHVVVCGVFAHAALTLAGYAYTSRATIVAQFVTFWSLDFALATLGLVLLVAIAVTSIASARRKFSYEVWYAIHLASYVAVAVAIPHMFSMGGLFAQGQWQRVYWTIALLATGVALLGYRVLVPLWRTMRHDVRLASVVRVGSHAYNLEFTGRDLDKLEARPGQYLNWRLLAPGLWTQSHPMSLSATPTNDRLRITVQVVGSGTAAMVAARPGTCAVIEGPYGVFTDAARTRDGLVLIGAGSGIAPIRALLEGTTARPDWTTVILRASRADHVLLADEISRLCRQRGVRLHVLLGPRFEGRWVPTSHATQNLATLAPHLADSDVYVCGPDGFITSVLAEATAFGLVPDQLHEERFAW